MSLKKDLIVMEFSYDYTYLYDVCSRIRKSVKADFPMFDQDDDPSDSIRFWDKEKGMILRITPNKSGIMFELNIDPKNEEEKVNVNECIRIFQKTYSSLISILDIREEIDGFTIVNKYTYSDDQEKISKIKNKIKSIENINKIISEKEVLEEEISFKYGNDYSKSKFTYEINNNEEIEVQIVVDFNNNFDVYNLSEEINKCDEEVQKFIE